MEKAIAFFNDFCALSSKAQRLVRDIFTYDELKKGEFFIKEGEVATEIALMETGIVRAFYINRDGKEYNKNLFIAPSIIGSYASLISKKENKLAQQALVDCKIWKAPFNLIEKLSENNIEIERLRRKIAERFFVEKEKKELEMALMEASERYLLFQKEYPGIELKISQYHIASYLGISPTQLSRIRKKISTQKSHLFT